MGDKQWYQIIHTNLSIRDHIEKKIYGDVISKISELQEKYNHIVKINRILMLDKNLLVAEKIQISEQLVTSDSMNNSKLEKKLYKLQDELTNVHRQKGDLEQELIEKSTAYQTLESINLKLTKRLDDFESMEKDQNLVVDQCLQKIKDLESTTELLRDELESTQQTVRTLEKTNRELTEDNSTLFLKQLQLVEELAEQEALKAKASLKIRNEEREKELKEVSETFIKIEEPRYNAPMFTCCSPPTHLQEMAQVHDGEVNYIRWAPSGKFFASGGSDRKIKLWSTLSGKCELKSILIGSNAGIHAIDISSQDNMVLGAGSDSACRVWREDQMQPRDTLTGHTNVVLAARFISGVDSVVTGSRDRTLKIWDLRSRQCVKTILANSTVHDVVVCHPLSLLISGHFDQTVRLWDLRGDQSMDSIHLPGRVTGLDITADMNYVLACTRDDTLHMVDLRMNEVMHSFRDEAFHIGTDETRPCFSPDGSYVCAGGGDGTIFVWNVSSQKLEATLRGHKSVVVCCHWNPAGNSLISCDRQRCAGLWTDY